jgi:hypothetical protein
MRTIRLLLACACALVLPLLAAAPASAGSCTPGWKLFETVPRTQLLSVGLVPGTTEAWAVGRYSDPSVPGDRLLIMRFDGQRWGRVSSPQPDPALHGELRAVFARSASDVWAVGHQGRRTLVLHWDGSRWSIAPSQNPVFTYYTDHARLNDVVALARDDAKAVGHVFRELRSPQLVSLTERWNGSDWRIRAGVNPGDNRNKLSSVARVPGSRTLWSVGYHSDPARPLIARYANGSWTQIAAPSLPGQELNGVTALAQDDAWAVGNSGLADGSALTLHYDGNGWSLVPSPPSPGRYGKLSAVSAVSASDVWAVGVLDEQPGVDGSGGLLHPLMQHWDGSSWSITAAPIDDHYAALTDVAMRRSGWGWSVGWSNAGSHILRHQPC